MAHNGQVDGLAQNEPDNQDPEPSNLQEVKMMKGLLPMMKQQLKDMKTTPSSVKAAKGPAIGFINSRIET
eukprot:12602768-Prorocentrum_lima.AAC.1